ENLRDEFPASPGVISDLDGADGCQAAESETDELLVVPDRAETEVHRPNPHWTFATPEVLGVSRYFDFRNASRSVAGHLAVLAMADSITGTFPSSNGTRRLSLQRIASSESCAAAVGSTDRSAPLRTEIPKNRSRCERKRHASRSASGAPSTA